MADLVTPPSDATLNESVITAIVFTVKNSDDLTEKLVAAKAGDTIKLDGKFGSTTEYVAYTIDKKITIQGLANNAVYGTFLIKGATADGTIIDGVNLFVRGGEKDTKVLKNGIQIVSNTATVKNCVISLPNAEALAAGGDVGNGIVIWPLKEGTNSYTIFGNTFNGFKANVKDWASTAINVAENIALDRFDLTGATSEALGYTEEKELAFARDNTFVDCTYNYSRNDWGAAGVQAITVVGNELFIEAGTNYTKIFAFENLSVKQNLEIKTGTTLTIAKGATLTIPKDVTLTNNGAIVNNGAIANGGAIVNNGAFTNNGTVTTVVDTLAGLKAAIAIGGNIEVKPGTYTLDSGLVIDKTVSIKGAGDSTIIDADNAFNAFEIGNDSGNAFDVSISNLKITNAYQGIGLSQSKLNKLRNATISGVNFESFTSKGIYLGGASGKVIVESCKFDGKVLSPEGLPTQQRSGSGVDVDLHGLDGTVRAVTLEIKNNTFKNFQNSGSTSGAIKLKNRGAESNAGYGTTLSQLTAILSGNTYTDNNRDLVIGTSGILSTYPKSLDTTNDKNLTAEKTYDFAKFGKTKVTTSEELVKILGAEAKYRKNVTIAETFELAANATIQAGTTLTIPANKTLTIAAGKTLTNNGTIVVNDEAGLRIAVAVGGNVKLGSDIAVTAAIEIKKDIVIDGNGKKITAIALDEVFKSLNSAPIAVEIKNLTVTNTGYDTFALNNPGITLTLTKVNFKSQYAVAMYNKDQNLIVNNSTLHGWTGIMTGQHSIDDVATNQNRNSSITVRNSTIIGDTISNEGYGAIVLQENAHQFNVVIEDSIIDNITASGTLDGKMQSGISVRSYGNNLTIKNTTINAPQAENVSGAAVINLEYGSYKTDDKFDPAILTNIVNLTNCTLNGKAGEKTIATRSVDEVTVDGKKLVNTTETYFYADIYKQLVKLGWFDSATLTGANVLPKDFTIPANKTLTIAAGATLTIPAGVTLTNNGTLVNAGIITNDGNYLGEGTVTNTGTLNGNTPIVPKAAQ